MDLQTYNEYMASYRRLAAIGDWREAAKAVHDAILACPVPEALPTLSAYHAEAELKSRPVPIWRKWLGVSA